MLAPDKPRGTWLLRVTIRLLTAALALLSFWVLGFLVDDIRTAPGPQLSQIEATMLDPALEQQRQAVSAELEKLRQRSSELQARQQLLDTGSGKLQQTLQQLIDLQRAGMENSAAATLLPQQDFSDSLQLFLQNQRQSQLYSEQASELLGQQQTLTAQLAELTIQIEAQRMPALEAFDRQQERHRLKLAFIQLAVLLPILLLSGWLLLRHRHKPYFPLFLAIGGATLIKVALVMHQYFPSRYFKYVLIGLLLVVVVRLLLNAIRANLQPAQETLLKQYREAYEHFLCPVCEFPIRSGPRRFLFWTRRTVNKVVIPASDQPQQPYCCPSCSTTLFETCTNCGEARHSLLPACSHCGDTRLPDTDDPKSPG